MAFVTTGLTNGGVTAHYRFSYDDALAGPGGVEPARTNAVVAACESDYNLMVGWFGGVTVTGMSVQVTTASNGASWSGTSTSSTIQLNAQGAGYSSDQDERPMTTPIPMTTAAVAVTLHATRTAVPAVFIGTR